jgi:Integrin alpha
MSETETFKKRSRDRDYIPVSNCTIGLINRRLYSIGFHFLCSISEDPNYVLQVGQKDNAVAKLRIEIKNNGEDAHETSLTITLPEFVEYQGADSLTVYVHCTSDLICCFKYCSQFMFLND